MTAVNFGALVAGATTTVAGKAWYCDGTRWLPAATVTPSIDYLGKYVCVGGETTITFSNLSQDFSDLEILFRGRDTASATALTLSLLFNGDTTAGNYTSSVYHQADSSGPSSIAGTDAASANGLTIGLYAGVSGDANAVGVTRYLIPGYAQTTLQKAVQTLGSTTHGANFLIRTGHGKWKSAAAINSLTITKSSSGTSFAAGTTVLLYGRGRALIPSVSSGVVTVSETAPVSPSVGNLWFCTAIGSVGLYVYYNDGDTSQWVACWQSSGSADVVTAQPGSGGIIIPGLQASPDIRGAGSNDDEFDSTSASGATGWTTLGSPTTHNVNMAAKSHYYLKAAAGASLSWGGIYKAVPATPFTVTAKLAGVMMRGNYNAAGLFIGVSPPGKMEILSITMDSSTGFNGPVMEHVVATTPTTFGSLVNSALGIDAPAYFKIVVVSSTDVSFYFSKDGVLWRPTALSRNPGFTVGVVGLASKSESASYTAEGLFDWIRFS